VERFLDFAADTFEHIDINLFLFFQKNNASEQTAQEREMRLLAMNDNRLEREPTAMAVGTAQQKRLQK
jgi:hypothetical protein